MGSKINLIAERRAGVRNRAPESKGVRRWEKDRKDVLQMGEFDDGGPWGPGFEICLSLVERN